MKTKTYFAILLISFLLTSCGLTRPSRECKIEDMLLTENDFPAATIINSVSSPITEMPTESVGFSASYVNSPIYHEVGRFLSTNRAERKFRERIDLYFKEGDQRGPWQTPVEISYISHLAQQYYVACGNVQEKYQCRMIGQYEEYYVFFFAYITDNGITLETFQDLLQKIDGHMAQCLQD